MNTIIEKVALFMTEGVPGMPVYLPGTPEMEPMLSATRVTEYMEIEFSKLPTEIKDVAYLKANAKEIIKSINFLTAALNNINNEISLLNKQAYLRSLNDI